MYYILSTTGLLNSEFSVTAKEQHKLKRERTRKEQAKKHIIASCQSEAKKVYTQ